MSICIPFSAVHPSQAVLLLAAAMLLARSLEASSYNLANERSSIERTYELTKYLEHQLKEIKDTYVRTRVNNHYGSYHR